MSHQSNRHHALSFGQAADLYDGARPTYPQEALHWAFGEMPIDIADLGAGTGLLTRGLIAMGHRVTAVEPDEKMLSKLVDTTTDLAGHHASRAEEAPLGEDSVDAVAAGQAYHWFEPERALPRIRSMLREGGVFCPIWNVRDESVDWVKQLTDIVGASDAEITAREVSADPGVFAPTFPRHEMRVFDYAKPLDADGLVRLVKSRSYYITASEERKAEILVDVNELLHDHPQLANRQRFEMPYLTHVFKAS